MIVARVKDWISANAGEQIVMMSVANGRYIGLSPVGARVWELIATPRDADEICTVLVEEFDVLPGVCRAQVLSFLNDLEKQGAVTLEEQF